MTSINNKEYLKKYLSIGKAPGEKKKKKKKQKGLSTRLKIVDDDILVNISEEIQHDLEGEAEDAPLIVSVIDDRPPSLRVDEESHTKLWKPIGSTDNDFNSKKSVKLEGSFKLNKPQSNILPPKTALKRLTSKKKDNDFSPSRIRIKEEKRFLSLDNSPPRSKSSSKDISPQRKIKQEVLSPTRTEDNSSPRRDKSDVSSSRESFNDISPLRKNKRDFLPLTTRDEDSDKDNSSPGKRERTEDISPPRKRVNDISPPRRNRRSISPSHRKNKREKNEDVSPLRKRDNDISPPRRNRRDISPSPPRKYKRDKSEDISPPRKTSINISPPRRERGDRETREQNNSPHREKKTRWGSENNKLSKTLEGKTAGLQNALDLAKETIKIKHKNDEMFKNMSVETSGKNAATVVRNFLRKKQKEVDPEEEEQKRITDEQNKEKYDRWGKGLKQVEAQNARMEDMAHEMSKPLARYADDMDLERHLKDQEREGDPMLAYMRKKKRKADVDSGKSIKPQFEGEFPPNRFGIPPGYRWDGVDRSTGYEKKYFEVQNKRKADIEEAYKWSTEDM